MRCSGKTTFGPASKALLVLFLASLVWAAGCSKRWAPQDDSTLPIEVRLQNKLNNIVASRKTGFPGAVVFISGPEFGSWAGAAGLRSLDPSEPAEPGDRFRAGSIAKPFISTVILQLVEEGRLSLDEAMTAALPENITGKFSQADRITVRMLLNHTSGIAEIFTKEVDAIIVSSPYKIWSVEEYLDIAAAHGPDYPPGQGKDYSNTNYILLGRIIEGATGNTWREEVRDRIIRPLGLENTSLPEPGDFRIAGDHLHGYEKLRGRIIDLTEIDPSMADAAGGGALVTTAGDLAKFMSALLAGSLFNNKDSMENMLDYVEIHPGHGDPVGWAKEYGLGIYRVEFPGGIDGIGHGGETAGYSSFVFYLPSMDVVISGAVNTMDWWGANVQLLAPMIELLNSTNPKT